MELGKVEPILREMLAAVDAAQPEQRDRVYQAARALFTDAADLENTSEKAPSLETLIERVESEYNSQTGENSPACDQPREIIPPAPANDGEPSAATSPSSAEIFLTNFMAAALLAVIKITTAISIAALIFSGPLAPYLSTGIGLFFFGSALGGILVALGSGYKAVVAGPRSGQAPLIAAMVAGVAVALDGQASNVVLATAIASILVSTIFIGFVLFAIGWAKLGGMIRYIPYPVMGGFFAGLGFLLLKGGMLVALGPLVDAANLSSFLSSNVMMHLAPALIFAVLLYIVDQKIKHWLVMPVFLIVAITLFYAGVFTTGGSVETASAQGWLPVIDASGGKFFPTFTPDQLPLVDWSAILAQSSTILVMAMMSVIMVLLDTSGVEIMIDRDLDPNRELKAAGFANVITGALTGPMTLQAVSDTAFIYKLGADRFLTILIYGLLIFGAIWIGPAPISYVPTFMLGGLLIYIGIDFLMKWVWYARKKLPLTDFAVVCGILFVVAAYGILQGVAAGVLLAVLLFVHSYSKLSVIKSSLSGAEHVSNVDRSQQQRHYLDQHGEELQIFVLQGFLFFGTASRLIEDIRALLDNPEREKIRYLVMDFHHVVAMDTSAVNSFAKLLQVCRKGGIALVLCDCSDDITQRMLNLVQDDQAGKSMHFLDNLDEGVSWCDDRILDGFGSGDDNDDPNQLLATLLGNPGAAEIVSANFEKISFKKDETLFKQGDPGNSLYLILSGSVSIVLDLPNAATLHLRTMRAGAILGEMALYTGQSRSATALVNENSVFFRLDQNAFDTLNDQHPQEAGMFHSFIVRLMAERLGRANKEIMALSR